MRSPSVIGTLRSAGCQLSGSSPREKETPPERKEIRATVCETSPYSSRACAVANEATSASASAPSVEMVRVFCLGFIKSSPLVHRLQLPFPPAAAAGMGLMGAAPALYCKWDGGGRERAAV